MRRFRQPAYPAGARRRGEEGTAVLEVRVGRRGRALEVELHRSSGFAELDAAAERAVRRARFRPARRGPRSVEATLRVAVTFRLED